MTTQGYGFDVSVQKIFSIVNCITLGTKVLEVR
jgi:hypothetical protein